MGYRDCFRFATVCAFARFSRAASAACGISALVQAGIFGAWGFVRGRIKESDGVRCACQVIVVVHSNLHYGAMPFAVRVRNGVVRYVQFMGLHAFFFCGRVLFRHDGRLYEDRAVRIFGRAIVVGGDRLVNEGACHRRVIVLFVSAVVQVLFYLLDACGHNDNEAIVSIDGVRYERFDGLDYSEDSVLYLICGPRDVSRAVAQDCGVMCEVLDDVFLSSNVRLHVVEVYGRCQFGINVIRTSVFRTVFFFIAANRFVLLSGAVRVVERVDARGGSMLYLAVRYLDVSMVIFFVVLRRPTFILGRFGIVNDFSMRLLIVLVHACEGVCFELGCVVR